MPGAPGPSPLGTGEWSVSLHALNILDTPREERFDRLTRLARRVFNVPYVTISMIDTHRQWFKSVQGLTICQTSRDISFCAHAILFDDILYVENALKDPRFSDNPVVVGDPKVRFYAGCSLDLNGSKTGTFCIFDKKPRPFTAEDRQLLRDLATLAKKELAESPPLMIA